MTNLNPHVVKLVDGWKLAWLPTLGLPGKTAHSLRRQLTVWVRYLRKQKSQPTRNQLTMLDLENPTMLWVFDIHWTDKLFWLDGFKEHSVERSGGFLYKSG